ncbi:PTS glucose transporter subunit IIA [Psychrobacillus sp. FSL K6-2836]|uniref:PTS sugar transporter subunit IIA n=1 Tax=Psychrobacillus sp. FSL K6-2836 TaxID=2921548 RepID=UPI0030F97FF4
MFSKFMKKNKVQVFSPLNGQVIALEQVPDPVFSQKMMGEGVAIMPTGGDVVSPIDGTVVLISKTKHAIGIRTKDDTEVLIHVGLETVTLKGEGFSVFVNEGDVVSIGQKLLAVDWDLIKDKVPSIITPIVITNSAERSVEYAEATASVAGETLVMTVSSKQV